jgi:MFS transporter, AAHS family, 4-hydroxybenzoate transporter
LLLGMFVLGTQIALKGVSTSLYPAMIRATGSSCATAVGQIGGAFGLVVGGSLLQHGYPPKAIFLMATVPATISMICSIALLSRGDGIPDKAMIAEGKMP